MDNYGAASAASEAAAVTVGDGTGPKVVVATPRRNQRIAILTKAGKRRAIRFFGTASDDTKLRGVAVSLRRVSVTRARTSQARRCTFYDGKSKFTTRSCSRPLVYRATLKDGGIWAYRIPTKVKVRPGVYELTVTAIDTNSNASRDVKVRFRLVKLIYVQASCSTPRPTGRRAASAGSARLRAGRRTRESMQRAALPVSRWMIEAIRPQPGHRVLELAAGLGDTGLLAAELVLPGGR